MENKCVLFGILLCIGFVSSQNPTPAPPPTVHVEGGDLVVKPRSDITLNCIGSEGNIGFYISNRVNWVITFYNGTVRNLTNGFYKHQSSFSYFDTKYRFAFDQEKNGQRFNITIKDVQPSDDGIYNCTQMDEFDVPIHSSSVRVTVVSPVRKLKLELHDQDGIITSSQSFTDGDAAVKVSPGDYKVMCRAEGSNPQPQMSLQQNQASLYVTPKHMKMISGEGPTYNSQFNVDMLKLKAMAVEQLLMCEANIAGDFYQPKRAGIKLLVKIDKPHFRCDNFTVALGDRYRKIKCELHTKKGGQPPVCENVFWKFGDSGAVVNMGNAEKFTDPNGEYNIMESECIPDDHGVTVSLNVYNVKQIHISTTFYVVYGVGTDAVQEPIQINLKEPVNAGSVVTPVTLFGSLMMALIGRHIARLL